MGIEHETLDDVAVIRINGDLYQPSAGALTDDVCSFLAGGLHKVLLNFGRVPAIDAAGLGLLAQIHLIAAGTGAVIVLTNVSPRVRELFDLAGLSPLFDIVASESDALEDLETQCLGSPD
jgi:anti-anti-sigma factor